MSFYIVIPISIDVVGGTALLLVALMMNFVRGVVGTTLHPGAIIVTTDRKSYATNYPFLHHRTVVNY
jgi:hypothetical protein